MNLTYTRLTRRLAVTFRLLIVALAALMVGCDSGAGSDTEVGDAPAVDARKRTITIGLVAKSQGNAVFQVAYQGAQDAARELGEKHGVNVEISWQTHAEEDAQEQAKAIEQLSISGAEGIAVSCSDAQTLTSAIDKAVQRGSHVVTFDSDAPDSARFAFYGTDDLDCGQRVAGALVQAMPDGGNIAILAGNQAAPNLQKRRDGVLSVMNEHENFNVVETIYHAETPEDAATAVNQAQTNVTPAIDGWAFIGGWPLFTKNALRWQPGEVTVVSVDALPPMLEYLESGHVEVLLAQDCYGWGYESVRLLLDRILEDETPDEERIIAPLQVVTQENADDYLAQWQKWLGE